MSLKKVNIGIIGFGTVGSGTARILTEEKELIEKRAGIVLNLKRIADLDINTNRGIELPPGTLTANANEIVDDAEIDIVVELIGGIEPARGLMLEALRKGKDVVTANKALLAEKGASLFEEAGKKGRILSFEAAVAGGIPIIKTLREGLAANNIQAIYGIINGTSNYILSKMSRENKGFDEALAEAQKLGYAEADPTFDIEGQDATHKLTLLISLAYGIPLSYEKIYREGITSITAQDIGFAQELGYKVKPLAMAKAIDGEIEMRVHPTMVPDNSLISKVNGVFNAVYVIGDSVGESLYYGKGAGDMPTGSAVVSDIIDIARQRSLCESTDRFVSPIFGSDGGSNFKIRDMNNVESMYYFRFTALDQPGVLSKISGVLGDHNIGISAVIQKERREGEAVPLVVLSHKAREKDVMDAVETIDSLPVVPEKTMIIRVEGME